MGWWEWLKGIGRRARSEPLGGTTSTALVDFLTGGLPTAAGVEVSPDSAMRLAAVHACVQRLAENIAQLPLFLYLRNRENPTDNQPAWDHPLYPVLHHRPNPYITSYQFRQMMQAYLGLRGNAYAEIERDGAGRIIGLWPWPPNRVRVERDGWKVTYWFQTKGGKEVGLPPERVLHLRGLSLDGVMGLSPIAAARETIGWGMAASEFAAKFFANGATPRFALVHPGRLGEEGVKNVRESFEKVYAGLSNAHRVPVLEEAMEIKSFGVSMEDAQFLESRKFNRSEIAGIYGVPPHMIGDHEHSTFSNVENLSIQFVIYTLGPWIQNWEQQLNLSLLTAEEQELYKSEFLVDGLLRGDAMSRWKAYATAIQWGVMSPNEARDRENMPPREGGDEYLRPVNMAVSGFMPAVSPAVEGDDQTV